MLHKYAGWKEAESAWVNGDSRICEVESHSFAYLAKHVRLVVEHEHMKDEEKIADLQDMLKTAFFAGQQAGRFHRAD